MNDIVLDFKNYIQETLELPAKGETWKDKALLPFFMQNLYDFDLVRIMNVQAVLMIDKSKEEQTPATIKKHLKQVLEKWNGEAIYLRSSVSSYNRKRLIEQKVPFVVPGTQMYLPMLGIDLREHFRNLQKERTVFSPATQAVVLSVLYKKINYAVFSPSEMSKWLEEYSPMTMTRAFEEMKSAGIGEHEVRGKERLLRFSETGKSLWDKVSSYLKTPVKKRLYVSEFQIGKFGTTAGLSALACYSDLAEPKTPVYAIGSKEWKLLKLQGKVIELPMNDVGALEIELWSYRPSLFANNGVADRLSLFLSLKDSKDDRVEKALETMMESMPW